MAKEGRNKVKSNTSYSPKYVTSDEDTLSSDNYESSDDDNSFSSELVKNPNAMIKGLMRQVGARDELLEQQEELLVQERKISKELKKLLALEKGKVEKLDQELAKSKKTTCTLKSSIGALLGQHDVDIRQCLSTRLIQLLREEEVKWYQRSKTDKLFIWG
jgi:DNA-directed RNA polymerase subunit F